MVDGQAPFPNEFLHIRRLKQKRQYQRTQVTITIGSNLRFQNSGGRQELMSTPYQTRSAKAATLPKAST
jgi:hypothetical protein